MREIDKKLIEAIKDEKPIEEIKKLIDDGADVNIKIALSDEDKKYIKKNIGYHIAYDHIINKIKYFSIIDIYLLKYFDYEAELIDYTQFYENKNEKEKIQNFYNKKFLQIKENILFLLNKNFSINKFPHLIFIFLDIDDKNLVYKILDKIDCNFTNEWGANILMYSIFKGKTQLPKDIIEKHKCNLYHKDKDDSNVLFYAIAQGNLELIKYFINKEKNLLFTFNNNINPSFYAFLNNKKEIFNFLKFQYNEETQKKLLKEIKNFLYKKITEKVINKIYETNKRISFNKILFRKNINNLLKTTFQNNTIDEILNISKEYNINLDLNKKINNKTLLEIAIENLNYEALNLFIKKGANVNIILSNGKSLLETAELLGNKELINLIKSSPTYQPLKINNKADKLVNILKNFNTNSPIKYTTHNWSKDIQEIYGDFDCFMIQVKNDWKKIEKDLKELSPNLHKKINLFLFAKDQKEPWYKDKNNALSIGWSNLNGLKEWCNMGKNPFDFKLKESLTINKKSISTFGDVINIFKNEIEIRDNNLKKIFQNFRNILKRKDKFKVDLSELKGYNNFYTDVEKLKIALDRIAKIIHQKYEAQNKQNQHIKIKYIDFKDYSEIEIIHINSFSYLNPNIMLEKIKKGDFAELEKNLKNICDFSIKNKDSNKNSYRINYLISKSTSKIEKINEEIEGFTYILRFYK